MSKTQFSKDLRTWSKDTFKKGYADTFKVDSADTVEENIEIMSNAFADAVEDNSDKLFNILDKFVDFKLESALVTTALTSSSGGGPVKGKITIKGT